MGNMMFISNEVQYAIDPLNKFTAIDPKQLVEACGLIPSFISPEADDVMEEALLQYGMSLGEMVGGEIDKEGVYSYPGDPDLYPITRCEVGGKTIYIYEYGITAFVDNRNGESVVHRFD